MDVESSYPREKFRKKRVSLVAKITISIVGILLITIISLIGFFIWNVRNGHSRFGRTVNSAPGYFENNQTQFEALANQAVAKRDDVKSNSGEFPDAIFEEIGNGQMAVFFRPKGSFWHGSHIVFVYVNPEQPLPKSTPFVGSWNRTKKLKANWYLVIGS